LREIKSNYSKIIEMKIQIYLCELVSEGDDFLYCLQGLWFPPCSVDDYDDNATDIVNYCSILSSFWPSSSLLSSSYHCKDIWGQ